MVLQALLSAAMFASREKRQIPAAELKLVVSTTNLHRCDWLTIRLIVHNNSKDAITVVRPLDGSWDGLREPHFRPVFIDEHGSVIPMALGKQPGRTDFFYSPVQSG